jgi:nucleotide-binding universal stress UspA family protein
MNILSATDFLPKSEHAIERAAFLADMLEVDLAVVHAVAPAAADGHTLEERMRGARSSLLTRTSPLHWGWYTTPDTAVQFGRPAQVVVDQARQRKANLVVLGPHRNSAIADAVSGTIADKVLGAGICPLLIAQGEVRGAYRNVLVALDNAPHAGEVVRAVESLRLTVERPATVVHAYEAPYAGMMSTVANGPELTDAYLAASRAQALASIEDLLHRHSNDAGRYQVMTVERRPATAILGTIERLQPDLVVLGTRAQGRFRRALLGSVASGVARAAQCDVLLVPERLAGVTRGPYKRPLRTETARASEHPQESFSRIATGTTRSTYL